MGGAGMAISSAVMTGLVGAASSEPSTITVGTAAIRELRSTPGFSKWQSSSDDSVGIVHAHPKEARVFLRKGVPAWHARVRGESGGLRDVCLSPGECLEDECVVKLVMTA
jgi:hypothetical protein